MTARDAEESLAQIAAAIATLSNLVSRSFTISEYNGLEAIRQDMAGLRERLFHLIKVIHEGNGERAVMTRIALLEAWAENTKKDIDELTETLRADIEELNDALK